MMKSENLFMPQGGPIIMAQVRVSFRNKIQISFNVYNIIQSLFNYTVN